MRFWDECSWQFQVVMILLVSSGISIVGVSFFGPGWDAEEDMAINQFAVDARDGNFHEIMVDEGDRWAKEKKAILKQYGYEPCYVIDRPRFTPKIYYRKPCSNEANRQE